MHRVKIKESANDIQFVKDCGLNTGTVYTTYKKDNGFYEIDGFLFENEELEFLD